MNSVHSFKLSLAAVDGSLHEVYTREGVLSYVVGARVDFTLEGERLKFSSYDVKDDLVEGQGDEAMRRLEYELANSSNAEVVLMDRKLTMDAEKGYSVPKRAIGIVKDFDPKVRAQLDDTFNEYPWLLVEKEGELTTGYFKLNRVSWVFRVETNFKNSEEVLSLLYVCGNYPIPEALGYNYPLFVADKVVKLFRNRMQRAVELGVGKTLKYREFRSLIEQHRAKNSGWRF
ncbi:MAG: DNA double-strand break repair nuclease NurA [Candidatus Aramenus sulfurataquae]